MNPDNNYVTLGTSKQKTSKLGSFVAVWFRGGKAQKTKTVSIEGIGHELAYETIDLWAEDTAKENDLEYRKKTLKELKERLQRSIDGKPQLATIKIPEAKSNLNNIKFFKMEIRRAFKSFNVEKITVVLNEGLALLDELETERVRVAANSGKAKTNIAKAMYLTWVDTGVDATVWCTDEEIINEFNRLKTANQQGEINV